MARRHLAAIRYGVQGFLACLLVFALCGSPANAQAFRASEYYRLLRDFKRVLELPQGTEADRARKVENLTARFTLRPQPEPGIGDRARLMWNSSTGYEMIEGTPLSIGGNAGTEPKHGYRPRLIDLYANWKAASLAPEDDKADHYRSVFPALPPNLHVGGNKPYVYRSPVTYSLIADASVYLEERVEATLTQWVQMEAEATARGNLQAQIIADLKPPRNSPQLDNTITDAIARAIYTDHLQIKARVQAALRDSVAFTELRLEPVALPWPTINGRYAASGKVPLTIWAENAQGTMVGDKRDVLPGASFTLPLNNIGEQDGVATLCWSLRDEKVAALLRFPAVSRVETPTFAYTGIKGREQIFQVGFAVKAGQPSVWVAADGTAGARNRDAVQLHYTWNSSSLKQPFAWKVLRVNGATREPAASGQETAPSGTLTIAAGALARGTYVLAVQDDTRKDAYTDRYTFRVTLPAVAMVIGIDDYVTRDEALFHACDDASAIVEQLKARGYDASNLIWVFGQREPARLVTHGLDRAIATSRYCRSKKVSPLPGQPDVLVIEDAYVTAEILELARRAFQTLIQERRPAHALLFYSGHGQSKVVMDGSIADVLVAARPPDARAIANPYLNQFTELSALLKSATGPAGASHASFISLLDACRSNKAKPEDAGIRNQIRVGLDDGVLVLPIYSCSVGERSIDGSPEILFQGEPVNHGLFTYSLLKGVEGAEKGRAPSLEVRRIFPMAVDILRELVGKAKEVAVKKNRGEPVGIVSQTITIGDRPVPVADGLGALDELIQRATLFY